MSHRHLLPNEIDLLLDGEAGFGVAPLKAHVRECPECRAQLDEGRALQDALDHLPRFDPSPLFADRVMAQVHVFQPWHVAALDTVRRYVPRARPARVVAGALAGAMAFVLTAVIAWVATSIDVVAFFVSDLAMERARVAVLEALTRALAELLGEATLAALSAAGPAGIAVAVAGVLATATVAAFGFRALATSAGRRRS